MKFFWKIFFTTMFISIICIALSGYIIIDQNFKAQLNNEINMAKSYCEIVSNVLENSLSERNMSFYMSIDEIGTEGLDEGEMSDDMLKALVKQEAESMSISSKEKIIGYCVMDEAQEIVFSSLNVALDKTMIFSIGVNNIGWTLKKAGTNTYIQMISPINLQDVIFYIETVREVDYVFHNQRAQYELMIKIMLGMSFFAGIVTFLISKILMRRIVQLTETTKLISNGNLGIRVTTHGHDEVALLSQNFNYMADCLEEKMCELREEAERKELFVGAFSHELKTPLTSIIGYSDLMRQRKMNAEQQQICVDYIFNEGKRLETMSMRLLELIVLRKQSVYLEPVQIKIFFDEVKITLSTQVKNSQIELIYDIQDAIVPMETELMKTVVINLIDNARNAMDEKGTIKVSGRTERDAYILMIQDTGKGMEKQELEKITNAFYMVDKSRSRQHGGAGLGLSICNEIVALHGFELRFDSTVNMGTTVTIIMREKKSWTDGNRE